MKVLLTHCYTDKNKGDAAIIIATTQLIRAVCQDAEIHMMSTFEAKDPQFRTEHELISRFCNKLHPALFGQPTKFMHFSSDSMRIISFIISVMKGILLLASPSLVRKPFFTEEELYAFKTFVTADVIVSKGGSYLTTQNTSIRQLLSFITMLFPFLLAKRYRKKILIFSQSLGPVCGALQKKLFHLILKNCNHVFLRERFCLESYPEVAKLCNEVRCDIIPDSAFAFDISNVEFDELKLKNQAELNIGLTVVDHAFKYISCDVERSAKRDNYFNALVSLISFITKAGGTIHIFPQVTVANSHKGFTDTSFAKKIVSHFDGTPFVNSVVFYDKELTPFELKAAYSKMDAFVGTRLHSVIFSLSSYVPAINISYHGTKSRGIFNQLTGSDEFVLDIDSIDPDQLIRVVKKALSNRGAISKKLEKDIAVAQEKLLQAMKVALSN
ncbi:polysaccharide pyruvyl transferase family protein [Halodesulfovibrio aestuarii]|uniref:Polysaccharide pyruvyl transferase family protein n=1 Tax=Halodesulfovibrio aestuarii TaxID=126333 RepID=A0ABV4JWE6_9BACT